MNSDRAQLLDAEASANRLFGAIEAAGLIAPGKTEADLNAEIYELARAQFGVTQHWHKRIVRCGANTVCTFRDEPPVRTIAADDIVYIDLGPVFSQWEADIGRSYVLGSDPEKSRLVADLPRLFAAVKETFEANSAITGAELYASAQAIAGEAGWQFGSDIAGHLIGEFPHAQRIKGTPEFKLIAPQNTRPMRDLDDLGQERHWILEIHLVDRERQFGGFYERLL